MTRVVRIGKHLSDGLCEIHVERERSCSGPCSGPCGDSAGCARQMTVRAKNVAGLPEGAYGVVETETGALLSAAALFYVAPVVLFFVGYFVVFALWRSEAFSIGAGVALFLLSLFGAVYSGRQGGKRAVLLSVVAPARPPSEKER